jgi:hypothetical protein
MEMLSGWKGARPGDSGMTKHNKFCYKDNNKGAGYKKPTTKS